jgi:hypothetical protein
VGGKNEFWHHDSFYFIANMKDVNLINRSFP